MVYCVLFGCVLFFDAHEVTKAAMVKLMTLPLLYKCMEFRFNTVLLEVLSSY